MTSISNLPGYLPKDQRPKCRSCGATLKLAPMARTDGDLLFVTPFPAKAIVIHYGYGGDGHFCSLRCGYSYGLAVVRKR